MKMQKAIKYFGLQTAVAAELGLTRAAVSKWKDAPHYGLVPLRNALRLSRASNGMLEAGLGDYK